MKCDKEAVKRQRHGGLCSRLPLSVAFYCAGTFMHGKRAAARVLQNQNCTTATAPKVKVPPRI
eukprot:21903-Amphidinium_carterae.1